MEYKGYTIFQNKGRWDVYLGDIQMANTWALNSAKDIVDKLTGSDSDFGAKQKTFTVCASVSARVYHTVTADSLEEAIEKIRNGGCANADWQDEEWAGKPKIVSVTDDSNGEMFDNF